ncbi:MAG: hypothetical protein AAF184_19260 [Pseudomonadota bacterium]
MFSSKAPDHLAFLTRHLAAAAEQHGLDGALQRLAEAAPERYAQDVERLKQLLGEEPVQDSTVGLSPYETLAALLRQAPEHRERLLSGFVDYVQQSRAVYETFLTGIIGFLWYVAIVSVVALVTTITYGMFVFPQVAGLLQSVQQSPPLLAEVMFQRGGAPILIATLLAALAIAAMGTLTFYRRIQQMKPMPQLPAWVPGAARLCRTYNQGLLLNFARLLNQSGVAGTQALDQAALLSRHRRQVEDPAFTSTPSNTDDEWRHQLAVAERLGTIETELSAQCEEHSGTLSMALLAVRERLSLILKLILFTYVGLLVISMYQPIFQSSSVI